MKIRTLSLLIGFLCSTSLLMAQTKTKPNITRLLVSMERLWRADKYLEAVDTAAYILSFEPTNRVATDFIYRRWDKMHDDTEQQLLNLSDENNLEQAIQRCEIYRLLDEINTYLLEVTMPLRGANNRWVWQPEISYYAGHYDSERSHVVQLLLIKADAALLSHDAEEAKGYYLLLLRKYLVTEGERTSNLQLLLKTCNDRLSMYADSEQLNDALFAWDLLQLSLTLDDTQEDIVRLKPVLQEHIAALYLEQSQKALLQGDSVQAREFELYADDWKLQ